MKCPRCREENERHRPGRPYCDKCDEKERTCTECGNMVDGFGIYIQVENGVEIKRGHRECVESTNK